jgi:hypothetical protein
MSAEFLITIIIIPLMFAVIPFGHFTVVLWQRHVTPRIEARHEVHRVTWSQRPGAAEEDIRKRTRALMAENVFMGLPAEIAGERKEKEFLRIVDWLRADSFDTSMEEIYLVARSGFAGPPRGLLYATFDKDAHAKPEDMKNRCFVWIVSARADRGDSVERLGHGVRLWAKLREIVRERSLNHRRECDFYFELPLESAESGDDLRDYLDFYVTFLRDVVRSEHGGDGVQLLDFDYESPEEEEPALLLYCCDGKIPGNSVSKHEILEFVYKTWFWGFVYGKEVATLHDLRERAVRFDGLRTAAENISEKDDVITVVPLRSSEARNRGLRLANASEPTRTGD